MDNPNRSTSKLVSIIVPIFNVEKYLEQCLDSIVKQSYENIEILLINDGSTDSSARIAENYAHRDSRITLFHKKNEGVSIARNFGIDNSKGESLVFVDSDDSLARDFIEYMVKVANQTNAEFCLSKKVRTHLTTTSEHIPDKIEIYTSEEAVCAFLYPEIKIGCWNKIFKRSFIVQNNLRFSNKYFMGEGLNYIVNAAQLASKIGVGNKPLYYYRTNNSDSATTKFDVRKIENAFDAIDNIKNNLSIHTPNVIKALSFHYWWTNYFALQSIYSASEEKIHKKLVTKYSIKLKEDALLMLKAEISNSMKIRSVIIWLNPILYVRTIQFLKKTFK